MKLARHKPRQNSSTTFFIFISLAHLVIMSGDRYLAIKHPYTYNDVVTAFRMLLAAAITWIFGLSMRNLLFVKFSLYRSINRPLGIAFVTIIVLCHEIVYKEIRRHEQQIAAQQVSEEARENFRREKRALKLTATVVFALLLSYVPVISFRIASSSNAFKNKLSLDVPYAIFFVSVCLLMLNSLISPLIYCVRVKDFRVAFIELLFSEKLCSS